MRTHEDERRVQVLVVLSGVISVKLSRLFAIYGEKVGSGVVGPEWFKKLLEGGMEAGRSGYQCYLTSTVTWPSKWRTTWDRFGRPPALLADSAEILSPQARTSPSAAVVRG